MAKTNKTLVLGIQIDKEDKAQAKKDIKEVADTGVKEQQRANQETINQEKLTNERIKQLVKERDKLYRKILKRRVKEWGEEGNFDWYYNNNKIFKGEANGGYVESQFYDKASKQWLDTPWQLEDKLKKKQQILDVEEKITDEKQQQNIASKKEEKITDEKQQQNIASKKEEKIAKTSFLETMGKGAKSVGLTFLTGVKGIMPTIGKVLTKVLIDATVIALTVIGALISAALSGLGALIWRTVAMIKDDSLVIVNRAKEINEMNKKIYTKTQVVKAMIDSIAYTLMPIIQKAIMGILDVIIEILRFVQHVVYALTGIDILQYTGERLAENMKKTSQYAKELSRVLMGFDEANILSDTGSVNLYNKGYADQLLQRFEIDENYFDKLKIKLQEAKQWWQDLIDRIRNTIASSSWWSKISGPVSTFFGGLGTLFWDLVDVVRTVFGIIQTVFKVWIDFFNEDWDQFFIDFREGWNNIKQFIINVIQFIWDFIMWPINTIKSSIIWFEEKIGKLFDYIKSKFDEGLGKTIQWICDRINDIKKFFNDNFYTNFEIDVDADTSKADKKIGSLVSKIVLGASLSSSASFIGGLGGMFSTTPGVLSWDKIKKLFKFDNGGIVLPQPGHGVPVGYSAVMSERRAEAVIPFENPTAMEKIGEAIGRYVNIAIENKMEVDGRVLATATNSQISKERFLMNR